MIMDQKVKTFGDLPGANLKNWKNYKPDRHYRSLSLKPKDPEICLLADTLLFSNCWSNFCQ